MAFKYREVDEKTVKERATQQGGAFDNFLKSEAPRYKVKNGENNIRILPRTWDDEEKWGKSWGIQVYVHYGVGADNSTYLCPAKMSEEDCPVCENRAELPPPEEGEQDELKPGKRVVVWLIDRDDEKAGPQTWAMPWTVERDIQNLCIDKKEGLLQITHPDEGYDISFSRDGKGRNVKYVGMKIAREQSPVSDRDKRQAEWLDFVDEHPLPDMLVQYDSEYLAKVYRAQVSRKEDGDEDDGKDKNERPSRSARPSAKKEEPEEPIAKKNGKGIAEADVNEMEEKELIALIKKHKLDVDPDDYPRLTKLRAKVVEELKDEGLLESEEEPEPEPAPEPDDKITQDELDDMDEAAFTKLIKKHGLDVDPDKYPRESKLREAVAEALEENDLLAKPRSTTDRAKERLEKLKEEHAKDEGRPKRIARK